MRTHSPAPTRTHPHTRAPHALRAEEWSYPYVSYTGETNGTCAADPQAKITIDGYVKLVRRGGGVSGTARY